MYIKHFSLICCSDIHKMADEIAAITKLNVSKIRLSLIDKWLPSSAQSTMEDMDAVSIGLGGEGG